MQNSLEQINIKYEIIYEKKKGKKERSSVLSVIPPDKCSLIVHIDYLRFKSVELIVKPTPNYI